MQMLISQLVGLVEMLNFALLDKDPAQPCERYGRHVTAR